MSPCTNLISHREPLTLIFSDSNIPHFSQSVTQIFYLYSKLFLQNKILYTHCNIIGNEEDDDRLAKKGGKLTRINMGVSCQEAIDKK
jgi:hypothetical protein